VVRNRVAVKMFPSSSSLPGNTAEDAFKVEMENLQAVRSVIDRASRFKMLPLSEPCESGPDQALLRSRR